MSTAVYPALALFLCAAIWAGPTFTPVTDLVPDVGVGDQTPTDGLRPDEISSPQDTRENQAPEDNIFDFPNAVDLFSLISAEATPEDLVYRFVATPILPGQGTVGVSDDRISINGVRILSTPPFTDASAAIDAAGGLLTFKDEAFSADADASPISVVDSITYAFGPPPLHPDYQGPISNVTADLIDANIFTVEVSGTGFTTATQEFAVFTVDDGPDALSGGVMIGESSVDLAQWAFHQDLNGPVGNSIEAETGLVTAAVPDNDADGSISDLQIGTASTVGNSFNHWGSPPDLIPFVDGGTFRTLWTVSSSGFGDAVANTPEQRFRFLYGFYGGLGNSDLLVEGFAAPPPVGGSRTYSHVFDHFEGIAGATGTAPGLGDFAGDVFTENAGRLLFDWVDILDPDNDGGGTLELDSVVIQQLDRAALLAGMSTIDDISNFPQGVEVDLAGTLDGDFGNTMTVVFSATNATVTSTGTPGTAIFTFGGRAGVPMPVDFSGVGQIPNDTLPVNPDRRIYRGQITVTPSATDVPQLRISTRTFDIGPGLTSSTSVNAIRRSASSGRFDTPNPALTVGAPSDFPAYLEIPSGTTFAPGLGDGTSVGTTVATDLQVLDNDIPYVSGGGSPVTVTVSRILLQASPPDIIP